jgi:putative two-component system response regulator
MNGEAPADKHEAEYRAEKDCSSPDPAAPGGSMGEAVRLLVVEDSENDAELILRELRRGGFSPVARRVDTRMTMEAALDVRGDDAPWDAILLDYNLPGFGGLQALESIRARDPDIPVIIVSGTIGEEIAVVTMRAGAQDYVLKHNLTRLPQALRRELGEAVQRRERKRAERELHESLLRLGETFTQTAESLASLTEFRDAYTAGHQRRVAELACAIAVELGFSVNRVEGLRLAAVLHDIGKIHIPAEILVKPGKLNELEWQLIKAHPRASFDILAPIDYPWPVAEIAYQHHERLDGSGYPRGLTGDEILPEAQVLAVADVVEAMSSDRPYRAALGIDIALKEIAKHDGTKYDATAAKACALLFRKKDFEFSDGHAARRGRDAA